MFTRDDAEELRRLEFIHRYYLDARMSTMQALDTLRPTVMDIQDLTVNLVELLVNGDISVDEANTRLLSGLRIWHTAYRKIMHKLNSCPN